MPTFWSISVAILPTLILYFWIVRSFPAAARRRDRLVAVLASFVALQLLARAVTNHWRSPLSAGLHLAFATIGVVLAITSLPLGLLSAICWALEPRARRGTAEIERAAPERASVPADLDPSAVAARGAADGETIATPSTDVPHGEAIATPSTDVPHGEAIATPSTDVPHGEAIATPSMTRRQVIEGTAGATLFGLTGALLGWGIVRGRLDFRLTEIPISIAGLPRALDGYVIAQVSDIHTGLFVGEREIDEGMALVGKARPDLLVVTGDLVDSDATFAPLIARKLRALAPRDGVVACLGNHDCYAGASRVRRVMSDAGIDMLVDEGRVIRPGDGGGFALLGVDDLASRRHGRGGPRLDRALSMVPAGLPRILLSHQPPTVDRWPGQVALQLSGHTHGGQVNPGGVLDPIFEYVAGRYSVGGTTLYVNRGFGTVGPPARVGSPPEVTRVVLVAA